MTTRTIQNLLHLLTSFGIETCIPIVYLKKWNANAIPASSFTLRVLIFGRTSDFYLISYAEPIEALFKIWSQFEISSLCNNAISWDAGNWRLLLSPLQLFIPHLISAHMRWKKYVKFTSAWFFSPNCTKNMTSLLLCFALLIFSKVYRYILWLENQIWQQLYTWNSILSIGHVMIFEKLIASFDSKLIKESPSVLMWPCAFVFLNLIF